MTLILADNPAAGSNSAPEWQSTPNPQWDDGVGGTYDLDTLVYDADQDTISYSLNAGSASLPTGVTLASNGVLTATAAVTEGTTTGIIVDADDGTAAAVASPTFSVVINAAGASPVQDVIFLHSENNLAPTELSPGVPGLFTVSKVTNSHEFDDPPKARWHTLAASGNNPIYPGENYFDVYAEQIDSEVYRVERSGSGDAMKIDMVSAGSDEWYASEKYYYGMVFRVDRLDNFGVRDFPSPDGGGLIWQFHMRNWDPPTDYNPPVGLGHQVDGIYLRIEGSREPDGNSNGNVWYQIWDDTVAGTAGNSYQDGQILGLVYEVLWDSRTNADGGTGYIQVYKDGATTPTTSHGTPASPKSNLWPMPHLDLETPPRTPYLKYGCYRSAYIWWTNDLLNGDVTWFSYGNVVMHGSNANIQGVWESLNWDNRVGA